ncbi:MAG TPA: hypothetical protein VM681_02385 [Candidatus Thermoplasmatota archaeon]|nr:hypothetical protein [Candidatus Thermoplasmatota archaeon]
MNSRAVALSVLFLAGTLAGCAGPTPPPPPPNGNGGDEDPVAHIPRWNLGDAWTYTAQTSEFPASTSTMVAYDDDGNHYWVGVTDRTQALVHALFNVNPQLGRIQKGNLAIYEKGEPRAMYRFPIRDGDTWDTDLFLSLHKGTLRATATYREDIPTRMGPRPGFEIVATNNAGFRLAYDFIPQIKWFSKLQVTDGRGQVLHDLQVSEHRTNVRETAYFVRGDDLFQETFGPPGGLAQTYSRTVLVDGASSKERKPYDVLAFNVRVQVGSSANERADVRISDPAGRAVYERTFLQSQTDEFRFETIDQPRAGNWRVEVTLTGTTTATVMLAGAWEYYGTAP